MYKKKYEELKDGFNDDLNGEKYNFDLEQEFEFGVGEILDKYTNKSIECWYEYPFEEKNFATLLDMIDASEVREDDETYINLIYRLFEVVEKKEPTHFAVKKYKKYKLAAGVIELRRTLHHYLSERCFA